MAYSFRVRSVSQRLHQLYSVSLLLDNTPRAAIRSSQQSPTIISSADSGVMQKGVALGIAGYFKKSNGVDALLD